jgi:hypothetical protein
MKMTGLSEAKEERMKRAKPAKRASSKATLDHVTGSTGRDGAFDFASRTEVLSWMGDQPERGGANAKVDEFKKKAEQCARQAARATEAGVRSSYQKLARSWRELAQHTEELMTKRGR